MGYAREGSNPSVVAIFTPAQWSRGAMDSAPDFESGGWGFESLRDRFAITISAIGLVVKYLVANEVPRVRFPDGAFLLSWRSWQRVGLIIPRSWVRNPPEAFWSALKPEALMAQLAAPRSYEPMVRGSSPRGSSFTLLAP